VLNWRWDIDGLLFFSTHFNIPFIIFTFNMFVIVFILLVWVTILAAFAYTKIGARYSTLVALTVFLKTARLFAMTSFGMEAFLFDFWFESIWVSI